MKYEDYEGPIEEPIEELVRRKIKEIEAKRRRMSWIE